MLSTIFEVIGMVTVAAVALLTILTAMGAVIMVLDRDGEEGMSLFSMGWGFDDADDEYL